ncbi:MAG: hypothetical protein ROW48_16955 [Bellilinea sp.]
MNIRDLLDEWINCQLLSLLYRDIPGNPISPPAPNHRAGLRTGSAAYSDPVGVREIPPLP